MGIVFEEPGLSVGILLGNQRGGFVERIWEALARHAQRLGAHLVVFPGELDLIPGDPLPDFSEQAYDFVAAAGLDALLMLGNNIRLHGRRIQNLLASARSGRLPPLCVLGEVIEGFPCVVLENETGMREAMAHLLSAHGYRRIARLGGVAGHPHTIAREAAYRACMREAGIEPRPEWLVGGDFSFDSGLTAVDRFLEIGLDQIDAILCDNDDMALGLMRGFHLRGITVPGDIRVMGFDDSCEGQVGLAHVTSIRQPYDEMVLTSLKILADPAARTTPAVHTCASHLAVRTSCGCLPYAGAGLDVSASDAVPGEPASTGFSHPLMNEVNQRYPGRFTWFSLLPDPDGDRRLLLDALVRLGDPAGDTERSATQAAARSMMHLVNGKEPSERWEEMLEALRLVQTESLAPLAAATLSATYRMLQASAEATRVDKHLLAGFRTNNTRSRRIDELTRLTASESIDALRAMLDDKFRWLDVASHLLVLHEPFGQWEHGDPANYEQAPPSSRLVYAYGFGTDAAHAVDTVFPTARLLPEGMKLPGAHRRLILEPLFMRNQVFGYQLYNLGETGEALYESLRFHITTALYFIRIIQRLREAMNSLQLTQRQLIQSEKMAALGTLVSGFAHELNTPLGVAVTASSYLGELIGNLTAVTPDPDAVIGLSRFLSDSRNGLGMLQSNLDRVTDLVSRFKRISAAQTTEGRRDMALASQLRKIAASLQANMRSQIGSVEITCPGTLRLSGSPEALYQVLSVLMQNTALHAHPDGAPARVRLSAQEVPEGILLAYEDDGVGIPAAMRERVFEPFYTTARNRGGTGLGLAVLYNTVTYSFGGSVECEAAEEGGARFLLRLPTPPPDPETPQR